jgi:hypothetical protein
MRVSPATIPSTSQSLSSTARRRSTSAESSAMRRAFSIASLSSSRSNGFVRYSVAPAFMASTAVATLPWAVSMMTGKVCPSARRRRSTSIPSGLGILWSSTMRSGTVSLMAARASLPSAASIIS